ncbi:MAG: hypothetical protein M3R45_12085 [Pseudomonadota bacterium]|nr:hypothetical protein [Pseudomonadota bacterium]
MTQHTHFSSYREKLIEHLFLGELLKLSWLKYKCSLEIARPEVDNSGYDAIVEANGIVRHIQIKASIIAGKTASQKIHLKLAEKPSACVLWIYFNEETMQLGPYLYFGALEPGKPMDSLASRKMAKHTKGNKDGFKAERENLRVLPKGAFTKLSSVEEVYEQLFGVA